MPGWALCLWGTRGLVLLRPVPLGAASAEHGSLTAHVLAPTCSTCKVKDGESPFPECCRVETSMDVDCYWGQLAKDNCVRVILALWLTQCSTASVTWAQLVLVTEYLGGDTERRLQRLVEQFWDERGQVKGKREEKLLEDNLPVSETCLVTCII